ncbi:MAG: hypothetical protein A2051_02975 [Desulfovibrionales bacterium GWA2_65_9]|nr:MAG: hypothetical protein A2051_02975 [Desulfovibrionales bacterium GWA2_65_9]
MEVGWHLRFSREDELVFLVRAGLAPNVEDAAFIAGDWTLVWEPVSEPGSGAVPEPGTPEQGSRETPMLAARVTRKQPRG